MSSQFGACTFLVISFLRFLITIWWQKKHIKKLNAWQENERAKTQIFGIFKHTYKIYFLFYCKFPKNIRPTLCVLSKTANLLRATQTADKPDDLFPSGAEDKQNNVQVLLTIRAFDLLYWFNINNQRWDKSLPSGFWESDVFGRAYKSYVEFSALLALCNEQRTTIRDNENDYENNLKFIIQM